MTKRAIFRWPLALAIASSAGLVVGLLGEGWLDLACWLGLAAPVAAALWAWRRRQRGAGRRRPAPPA